MVPSLADAVTIFSKWKEDSAEVLVVTESPFQQSRRGVLEQSLDWRLGMQGKIAEVTTDQYKGKEICYGCVRDDEWQSLAEHRNLRICVPRTARS